MHRNTIQMLALYWINVVLSRVYATFNVWTRLTLRACACVCIHHILRTLRRLGRITCVGPWTSHLPVSHQVQLRRRQSQNVRVPGQQVPAAPRCQPDKTNHFRAKPARSQVTTWVGKSVNPKSERGHFFFRELGSRVLSRVKHGSVLRILLQDQPPKGVCSSTLISTFQHQGKFLRLSHHTHTL